MNQIFIASSPGREHWVEQCSKSLGEIPHTVICDYGYELGKIRWIWQHTKFDRFLFLQDSVIIKDLSLIDMIFSYPKSVAISNCPVPFGMYLGVYSRETLDKTGVPKARTKEDAIRFEVDWSNKYCENESVPVLFEDFTDANATGTKKIFGRTNLVLENEYLIKYKGTWR